MVEMKDILIKILKGSLIGSGFIVPGVSGGALAMVFGVYERMIRFLGNIRVNFKENVRYFFPIAIGGILGVTVFARLVSFVMDKIGLIINWFFVGAIVGTLPSLWKEAGKKGRDRKHYILVVITFILSLILLNYGSVIFDGQVDPSFAAWFVCGILIALGVLIPGLSSSNFIVYMGLYKDMSDGFASLNMSVIIPIGLGGLLTVVLLIQVINKIYERYYSEFFHFIIGVVLASTVMIIPIKYPDYGLKTILMSLVLLALGIGLSAWMTRLEDSAGGDHVQSL